MKRSLAYYTKRKRGILIGCAIGGIAVVGLAVGLGVGLTQCNSKKDLTNEYAISSKFPTKPNATKILDYIKDEDARTENMGQDDFDWTWSPDNTQVKLIVKGADNQII